jgi:serine/threonine protein kinase
MNERDVFIAALQKQSVADRAAFLAEACAGNADLREQVEALLRENEQLGSFLESPAAALTAATDERLSERPGTVIGPYKLLEQIGEGGFGVVYMAEQQQPVRRKVALKVIKPGMDSKQVIARFEAERQALALMDHTNIARVLDAGSTPGPDGTGLAGRPYFVMELVRGIPITQFCDDNRLALPERLELFVAVCQAVQHAHQKGIIHRDLKPSNVLVTLHDGTPLVKVIDFGIAKALGQQRLTDKTLFTGFAHMIGTPWTNSMTKYGRPDSVVPPSKTRAILTWSIIARACRSASNRAMTWRLSMPGLMTLRATLRLTGSVCSAMKTVPMPPSPSSWRSL